jgi:hypothetical protein
MRFGLRRPSHFLDCSRQSSKYQSHVNHGCAVLDPRLWNPRSAAINDSNKRTGGIGDIICAISVIWQEVLLMWFFATLYRNLPLLGTYNRVWLFTAVDIAGWFGY